MDTFSFTLRLDVPSNVDLLSEEIQDALFEGGCDDATFGVEAGHPYGSFDREAKSFPQAIMSAVRDVETAIPGIGVRGIAPDDLVSASAIAERVGKSREYVRLLANGERGPGGFPEPVGYLDKKTRVWRWSDVSGWWRAAVGERRDVAVEEAQVIAIFDSTLSARWCARRLPDQEQRSLVFQLWTDVLNEECSELARPARRSPRKTAGTH